MIHSPVNEVFITVHVDKHRYKFLTDICPIIHHALDTDGETISKIWHTLQVYFNSWEILLFFQQPLMLKKKNILEQFNRKIEMAKKQVFYKLFSFGKSPFQCQLIRYPSTLPLFHLQHMLYNKPALLCDGIAVTCWTKQATRHLRKTLKHQITGEHWAISIATNTRADYTTFYECHGDILHWSHRPYLQHQTDG